MSTKHDYPRILVELRPSSMLAGEVGLFSATELAKGMIIAKSSAFNEEIFISWSDWHQLDMPTRQKLYDFCPGSVFGIMAPPDLNTLPIPWYINHSCEPNAAFDECGNLVALKVIDPNTEITWDYSSEEHNPDYRMVCKCGSPKCRGVITSLHAN